MHVISCYKSGNIISPNKMAGSLLTFSNILRKCLVTLIEITLKLVPDASIYNKSASVKVITRRPSDDRPLPEPMVT